MSATGRFARLPTAAKLLLFLSAALLPIGAALVMLGESGIQRANEALKGRAQDQSRAAAEAIQSLIARNALALRVAANGALNEGRSRACDRAERSLAVAPGVIHSFEVEDSDGGPICSWGTVGETGSLPLVPTGEVGIRIAPSQDGVAIRVGVAKGMATAIVASPELRAAALAAPGDVDAVVLHQDTQELRILGPPEGPDLKLRLSEWRIGNGGLFARVGAADRRITTVDRLVLLLPVLMWVAAALLTWLLVTRLLVRPLKRLEHAVVEYKPGEGPLDLPRKLGPSKEIQEMRDAFGRAVARVEASESEMAEALEGQRRLVREVHHRVKNNLQVIASLLNIHGRSASAQEARSAYAGISRRVGALSIVHRNHYAEMEENRGISLRPLIAELAAELRATAPEGARGLRIELDLDTVYTTQDVAVAVSFLITEIVEFAMLHVPEEAVEIALHRSSELTARLTLSSPVLVPEEENLPAKMQFERILAGLAKQLRSTLERKLGRYTVDLPAFPPI
jgi:two-component sensor histidine kinase